MDAGVCSWGYDLCGGRGIDPGIPVGRGTYPPRYHGNHGGIFDYDDFRRGSGIKGFKEKEAGRDFSSRLLS